jgi:hypothetical protein
MSNILCLIFTEMLMVGDQSLLYELPRNATIVAEGDVIIYSLSKQDFRAYQKSVSLAADNLRYALLKSSDDLMEKLSDDQRRQLVGKMHLHYLDAGEVLYGLEPQKSQTVVDEVFVIETGQAIIYTQSDFSKYRPEEVEKLLGIVRNTNFHVTPIPASLEEHPTFGKPVATISKGCILGIPMLDGFSGNGLVKNEHNKQVVVDGVVEGMMVDYSVVVFSEINFSTFTIDTFERLFGARPLTHVSYPS